MTASRTVTSCWWPNPAAGISKPNWRAKQNPFPALALVRVYGKVIGETNNVPTIAAEYIRVWPWLTFTLSDLGAEDHSNPRWAEYCKLCKGGRVYNPYPTTDYYLNVLGDPKDFGIHLQDSKQ